MTKVTLETSDPMVLRAVADALEGKYGISAPDVPSTDDIVKSVAAAQLDEPVETHSVTEPAETTVPDDSDVDIHGMPYNPEIHAETRNKNADGSWKARRGKAEEAKKALAEFKAAGGNITPPDDLPDTAVSDEPPAATQEAREADAQSDEPELPMSMPAAPTPQPEQPAIPQAQPEPVAVTQQQLETKILGMMKRGTLGNDKYVEVLTKNQVDLSNPSGVLRENDALRAAVYADMCEIEPEVA